MVGVEFINKIAGMIPYGSSMSFFVDKNRHKFMGRLLVATGELTDFSVAFVTILMRF